MRLTNIPAGRLLCAALLSASIGAPAMAGRPDDAPRWEDQTLDVIAARPLGIVATGAGAFLWGISLPFSLLGGNAGESADILVGGPARETFYRCLGCRSEGRRQHAAEAEQR